MDGNFVTSALSHTVHRTPYSNTITAIGLNSKCTNVDNLVHAVHAGLMVFEGLMMVTKPNSGITITSG